MCLFYIRFATQIIEVIILTNHDIIIITFFSPKPWLFLKNNENDDVVAPSVHHTDKSLPFFVCTTNNKECDCEMPQYVEKHTYLVRNNINTTKEQFPKLVVQGHFFEIKETTLRMSLNINNSM